MVPQIEDPVRDPNLSTYCEAGLTLEGRAIRQEVLEVFRPDDPAWGARILEGGARLIECARDGLANPSGA